MGFEKIIDQQVTGAEEWQERSLCRQTDPEAFFPERGQSNRAAKAVCRACPVREQCLDYAIRNREQHGIWGGLSDRERRRVYKVLDQRETEAAA
jgi:WhiB family redox-sensing transcriptional regulator